MFTFSFGSAFAAITYDKGLADTYFTYVMKNLKTAENTNGYAFLVDNDVNSDDTADGTGLGTDVAEYKISYAVLEQYQAELADMYKAYVKANAGTLDAYPQSAAQFAEIALKVKDGAFVNAELLMNLVAAQYEADKASALAILGALDTSAYSTVAFTEKDDDGCATYQEHVQYLIDAAVKDINTATFTTDSKVKAYAVAKKTIDDQFSAYATADGSAKNTVGDTTAIAKEEGYEGASLTYVGLGTYIVNPKKTVTSSEGAGINGTLADYKATAVDADNAGKDANIASLKAQFAAAYASYVKTATTEQKAYADDYKTLVDYLIEEEVITAATWSLSHATETYTAEKATAYSKAIADIENLEVQAKRLAAEKNATGALVRDAAEVDKAVVKAKKSEYKFAYDGTIRTYTITKALEDITKMSVAKDNSDLDFAIKSAEAKADKIVADAKDDETYYAKELAKVEDLVAEFKTKVEALTTTTKVTALYNTYFVGGGSKLSDIKTKDAFTADAKLVNTAKTYVGLYNESLKADAKYQIGTDSAGCPQVTVEAAVKKLVGDAGARTTAEIAALASEIPALVQALPTKAAVEAAVEAVDAAKKAVPTGTITLADKAAIDAAVAAIDAYEDLTADEVKYDGAMNAAITKLAYAEKNKLAGDIKNLDKTDKAAVQALLDEIEAFVEDYENADVFYAFTKADGTGSLDKALADIKTADAKAVVAKINAIPVNVTAADKSTVEAARAAYDKYVAEYTDYEEGVNAADDLATYAPTLTAAETVLGLNQPDPEENAKAYVQDLKIAARSTKTSKGVKVTINADVQPLLDEGFTVEYKFYRSTKSNKNFGTAKVTKTENTYLNTSGKKGTKYYYKAKLVVKNAEGEVVATTPLTQCLYATRTF